MKFLSAVCILLLSATTTQAADATQKYQSAMHDMHKAMMAPPYIGDPDVDFASHMLPHHQGAVDMARVELEHGNDERLKCLARSIIRMQEIEIGFMRGWLQGRDSGKGVKPNVAITAAYQEPMEKMHQGMNISYTGNADIDFARGMIPHHQGAIDMAAVELRHGKNEAMHKLASDIINSQGQEIAMMQRWLAHHDNTTQTE